MSQAIAWRVIHLGNTGAWYVTIGVAENFVVRAQGRRMHSEDCEPGRIRHRDAFVSNADALDHAMRETIRLEENAGYELDIEPRKLDIDPNITVLDESLLRIILNDGDLV